MKFKPLEKSSYEKALEHLNYEVSMFFHLFEIIKSDKTFELPEYNFAIFESFIIHVRVLIEFIYCKSYKYADDIFAIRFFNDPEEWISKRKLKSKKLILFEKAINKRIAHLSSHRFKQIKKSEEWNLKPLNELISNLNLL